MSTATVGAAQSTATKPYPPGFLKNLAQQMLSQHQTFRAGTVTTGESNSGNMSLGFHLIHATNCVALQIDPVNVLGCIFSEEGLFVCILNPSAAAAATAGASCASNNLVGINIFDDAGDANEIISYAVK